MLKKYLTWMLIGPALVGINISAASQRRNFPMIRPAHITIETSASKPEVAENLTINDALGRLAYVLAITAISMDHKTTHTIFLSLSTDGRYSPDHEEKYEPNLLSPDYWGHGEGQEVIHPEELCPANKSNPYYGARREFILRKMRIVVEISDFVFSENFCPRNKCVEQKGGLVKTKISIKVQPGASRRKRPIGASYEIKPCG